MSMRRFLGWIIVAASVATSCGCTSLAGKAIKEVKRLLPIGQIDRRSSTPCAAEPSERNGRTRNDDLL